MQADTAGAGGYRRRIPQVQAAERIRYLQRATPPPTMSAWTPVPAVAVIALCVLSFMAGRFTQEVTDLPDPSASVAKVGHVGAAGVRCGGLR